MKPPKSEQAEIVPLFGRWPVAYAFVVAAFALEVALFYLLDRCFA
ncbi:MAG: hypothetical protein ABI992_10750 [Chthoniobacterales bacterium]